MLESLPALHTFHPRVARVISAYENRSSAYRSTKVFLSRFGTVLSCTYRQGLFAPFMVELFAVRTFHANRRALSRPVACVAARKLPTPACVERGFRDLHPNCQKALPRTPRRDYASHAARLTRFNDHGPPYGGSVPVAHVQKGVTI